MGDTSRSALKGSPSLGSALSGLQIFFENYQEWGLGGKDFDLCSRSERREKEDVCTAA